MMHRHQFQAKQRETEKCEFWKYLGVVSGGGGLRLCARLLNKVHFLPTINSVCSLLELISLLQLFHKPWRLLTLSMAGLTWILCFICVAGCHLSEASPVLRTALVIPIGEKVSLTCNVTNCGEITWFMLNSDELLPLLTVTWSSLDGPLFNHHTANSSHIKIKADQEGGPVSLEILEVEEKDAGLYFCSARCEGAVRVNQGVHLAVEGGDGDPVRDRWRQPCFIMGVCALPALLLLCFLCMVGIYRCSGKPAVCCCHTVRSDTRQKDFDLHYSSLKHADKPRPSARGATGLVKDDVTYSTVSSRKDRNVSHDHR